MKNIINKLQRQQNLTSQEAFTMQEKMISGQFKKQDIIAIFKAFEKKAITPTELIAIVTASQKHMIKVNLDFDTLDNCGTGGDKLNTFNISTTSAIVLASLGIPIAKHGARAASSQCGTADVLEKLGIKINLSPQQAKKCINQCGIVYLFAPNFHPALKYVMAARREYGKRTYFNLIGPMMNPAGATHQLLGLADPTKANIIGKTLISTGSKCITIVYGAEGMDEVSISTTTQMLSFKPQLKQPTNQIINPKKLGLKTFPIHTIKGKDIATNAQILINILQNKATPAQTNIVLLNTAVAMLTFNATQSLSAGIKKAKTAIESGRAYKKLQEFIQVSNSL